MDIKIEYDKPDNFFTKYKMKAGGIHVNPNGIPGVVKELIFHPIQLAAEQNNGLPLYTQKMKIKFHPSANMNQITQAMQESQVEYIYKKVRIRYTDTTEVRDENLIPGEPTINTLFKNCHSYYNFQLPSYDQSSTDIDENIMPSFMVASYHKEVNSGYSLAFLGGSAYAATNSIRDFPINSSLNKYAFINHNGAPPDGSYDFSNNYYKLNLEDATTPNTMFNCFISYTTNKYKNKWYDVPYFNNIKVPKIKNYQGNRLRSAFYFTEHMDILMRSVHYTGEPTFSDTLYNGWHMDELLFSDEYSIDPANYLFQTPDSFSLYEGGFDNLQGENEINLEEKNLSWISQQDSLQSGIYNYCRDKLLDMKDMNVKFQDSAYENLFYRIIKSRVGRQTPVQAFHIFDVQQDVNSARNQYLIDTQIRLGAEYRYDFYPCVAQVFHYVRTTNAVPMVNPFGGDKQAEITYEIAPRMEILELDIGSFNTLAIEPPPPPPIIKFSNYVNKDNRIKISIQDRSDVRISDNNRKETQTINEQDQDYAQKLIIYNKSIYSYASSVATYGSFQVYRTERKPDTLSDFDGFLLQTINSPIVDINQRKKIKKFYTIHNLEHGKKYYYLFRALTHNGNYSNPSPVYEVEKIKDSDETILNVSSFNFKVAAQNRYEMSFRKFIKLMYPDNHVAINSFDGTTPVDTAFGTNVKIVLGSADLQDDLWKYNDVEGSYIKLRVESKSTGKKIDLNLAFNYNQPENN